SNVALLNGRSGVTVEEIRDLGGVGRLERPVALSRSEEKCRERRPLLQIPGSERLAIGQRDRSRPILLARCVMKFPNGCARCLLSHCDRLGNLACRLTDCA